MQNVVESGNSLVKSKNSKLYITTGSIIIAFLLFIIHLPVIQDECQVTVKSEDIEYIRIYGFGAEVGDKILQGEVEKRLESESAKVTFANYINHLGRLKVYHQGDPIQGTPDYFINVYLYDGSEIHLEQGGMLIVRNNNSEKWYNSDADVGELFYDLCME